MIDKIRISDVMSRPVTVAKSAPITEALDRMVEEETDPVIVTNNGSVVGIVSRTAIADTLGSRKNAGVSPAHIHVANAVEEDLTSAYADEDLDVVIPLLQHHKLVVVLDGDHHLVGKVDRSDLLRVLKPPEPLDPLIRPLPYIEADERVVHMRRRMIDDGIPRFLVREGGKEIGMVTEMDVAVAMRSLRELVEGRHQDHRIRNLLVRDIMSSPLIKISRDASVDEVIDLMLEKKIGSVAVVDGGRVIGAVTRDSCIEAL
ncbi:MAG: CBS domain-containing protein [Methanoculleaceae archaeon]